MAAGCRTIFVLMSVGGGVEFLLNIQDFFMGIIIYASRFKKRSDYFPAIPFKANCERYKMSIRHPLKALQ